MSLRWLSDWLSAPVDNGSLVAFRVVFGLLIFLESAGSIATGWVTNVYVAPDYTFPHIGFGWLRPLPGDWMYAYYATMALPGALVMVGAYYRAAMGVFTVMWTLIYLGQTTSYNNHYYLLVLLCVLMWMVPANRDLSWDVESGRVQRSTLCPRWCVLVFVALITIVYSYAALAKVSADWLAARPMEIWMRAKAGYPVLGPLYVQPWFKWVLVYGGVLFDGLVVPLLLWRRTRWIGVGLSVFFHLFNSYTFRIGIFPYMGIAFCFFFFPGEEMRAGLKRTRIGRFLGEYVPPSAAVPEGPRFDGARAVFLTVFLIVQALLPLRHFFYPGDSNWTEEGHRMAWRMMLRSKSGTVVMRVVDLENGETWRVHPRDMLSPKQARRVATRPDMLWRFSRYVRERYEREGRQVAVYADTRVSLNGRRSQPLVDSSVDLSRAPWNWLWPHPWLVPLREEAERS